MDLTVCVVGIIGWIPAGKANRQILNPVVIEIPRIQTSTKVTSVIFTGENHIGNFSNTA